MNRNFIFAFVIAIFWPACKQAERTTAPTNVSPINLATEIARAKTENKILLLEFGSSDSCPPCMELEKEVFSKPEFQTYEKSNLVFARLDFPANIELPPAVQATNALLSEQFGVLLFPTFVALNHDGKEFWRLPKKGEYGLDAKIFKPDGFLALLESMKKENK